MLRLTVRATIWDISIALRMASTSSEVKVIYILMLVIKTGILDGVDGANVLSFSLARPWVEGIVRSVYLGSSRRLGLGP